MNNDLRFPLVKAIVASTLASAALVAASYIAAWALQTQTPFELLADEATRLIPAQVFSKVLDALKYWGKPLLLTGLSLGWLSLGAVWALAAMYVGWRRNANPFEMPPSTSSGRTGSLVAGAVLTALPLIIGGLVISPVAGRGVFGSDLASGWLQFTVAMLIAGVVFALAISLLAPKATAYVQNDSAVPLRKTLFNRRDFVKVTGFAALGIAGVAVFSNKVLSLLANAKPAYQRQIVGTLSPEVTPTESFYVISKNFSDPVVDQAKWSLEVVGEVDKPLELSMADIRAMPSVERYVTMLCISNTVGDKLVGNALWKGVTLEEMLRQVKAKPEAKYLLTYAYDGYSESLPLESKANGEVLIAYEMNGEPLTDKHGAPLRLIIPGRYGMKSTKWLTKLDFSTRNRLGYWEGRGWNEPAIIKTMSRIDVPARNAHIQAGEHIIGGIAFAGTRGIKDVQVSIDGGDTWRSADLRKPLSPYAWTLWTTPWKPTVDYYIVLVRAIDGTGDVQTESERDAFPDGSSGHHRVLVFVEEPGAKTN